MSGLALRVPAPRAQLENILKMSDSWLSENFVTTPSGVYIQTLAESKFLFLELTGGGKCG